VAAIIRTTDGAFWLLNRLLAQIERILEINTLQAVTKEAVEAARESLVIGQTQRRASSFRRHLHHCEIIHGCEARKGNPPRSQRECIDETNR